MSNFFRKIISLIYKYIFKPVLFLFDPESVHDFVTKIGKTMSEYRLIRKLTSLLFYYENPVLTQEVLGIRFKNPIGLSAGFDKDAQLTDILPEIGFGFLEVGSITGEPCQGNPKPRLWRLKDSKSLVVWYGLKNKGCEAIVNDIKGKSFSVPVGISVAMTNCKENINIERGINDFAKAFRTIEPYGLYITVNISCPNTEGGQPFILPSNLERLFDTLDRIPTNKPVFVKLSPDMEITKLDAVLEVLKKHRVQGIITTNLTKKRDNPKIIEKDIPKVGGISGKVVQSMSDDMLSYIYRKEGKRFILIGCGGVFTAEDVYRKIKLGASLVQMITGMIFEGPQIIANINRDLVSLLKKDGFKNIKEAVGYEHH